MRMKAFGANGAGAVWANAGHSPSGIAKSMIRLPASAAPALMKLRRSRAIDDGLDICWLLCMALSPLLGREVNGGADTLIRPATAHVAGHRLIDVVVSGLRSSGQQCRGRHDLARLTVAALHDVELEPGLLKSLANRRRSNRFDRGDGFPAHGTDGRYARAHGHAVDVDGAGAAQGDAAAELCTRDAEHVAQHPQERSVSIDVYRLRGAVNLDRECHARTSCDLVRTLRSVKIG